MLLVGPWRERGIAKQPIEFQFRYVVAFAGALPQGLGSENGDMAATIPDKPRLLQRAHHIRDSRSPDTEHHPQEFLGEQKIVRRHPVARHHEPAATALLHFVEMSAGGRLG